MTKTIQKQSSESNLHISKSECSESELALIFSKEIKMLKDNIPNPRPEMVAKLIAKIKNSETEEANFTLNNIGE